jgi:HEAT repeat protein
MVILLSAISCILFEGALFPGHGSCAESSANDETVRKELNEMLKDGNLAATGDSEAAKRGFECMDRLSKMGFLAEREVLRWVEDKKGPPEMRDLLASEVLPHIVDQQALPILDRLLHDAAQPKDVRVGVIRSIGAIGGKEALRRILAIADGYPDDQLMQVTIIRALGDIADKESSPILVKKLADKDPFVQVVAARALDLMAAKTHDKSVSDPLVRIIQDKNFKYRNVVVGLVGESDHREAIPLLAQILHDEKEGVRLEAADALGRLGGEEALTALISVFEDKDELVRAHAAKASVKAGIRAEHIPLLKRALKSSKSDYVRSAINRAIDQVKSK